MIDIAEGPGRDHDICKSHKQVEKVVHQIQYNLQQAFVHRNDKSPNNLCKVV